MNKKMTTKLSRILQVSVSDDTIAVDLEDGRSIAIPIGWYPRLAHATQADRDYFELSGAGYGIYWPKLDEDIGVEGLILGKSSAESQSSFARWLKSRT